MSGAARAANDGSEASPTERERALEAKIEALLAAQETQLAITGRLLGVIESFARGGVMGGVAPAVPVAAPPVAQEPPEPAFVDRITLADMWPAYLASLGTAQWVRNVEILMNRPLRHFAPSIVAKKFRASRYRHVIMRGPDMLVSALRPHHWIAFRDRVIAADRDVGVTTRNLMLTRTQAFLNWAVASERIAVNPLAHVKQEPKKPRRESTITEGELDAIMAKSTHPVFSAHMLAASDSGMRHGEGRLLRWDQIDFSTGRVQLSWTLTKSKKSRVVRLSPRAMDAIRALPRTSEYVFASPRGGPYSAASYGRWFRMIAAEVGIKAAPGDGRVTFHDSTRHTFATRMHKAGATLKEIQVALGHASIQTTALYLHTDEDALDKAHARLYESSRKGPRAMDKPKPHG